MSELSIVKGVNALKEISTNLDAILNRIDKNDASLLPHIEEIHKGCEILTDIFENAFTDMIEEKQRMEDDGK
jgi:hypothetical protein